MILSAHIVIVLVLDPIWEKVLREFLINIYSSKTSTTRNKKGSDFVEVWICRQKHFSYLIHKPYSNTDCFVIGIRLENIISD